MMAAIKAPGLDWILTKIQDNKTYDFIHDTVEGHFELIPNFHTKAILYCNEEGKMKGLKPNFPLIDAFGNMIDIICGTVVMMGPTDEEGYERDLTDELFNETKKYFGND